MQLIRSLNGLILLVTMINGTVIKSGRTNNDHVSNQFYNNENSYFEPRFNGTDHHRINEKTDEKYESQWYDRNEVRNPHCVRKAKCFRTTELTCFGAEFPYVNTSLVLTNYDDIDNVQATLRKFEMVLKNVPACWAVMQPFLCSIYFPRCDMHDTFSENGIVNLPTYSMCRTIQEPCAILSNTTYFSEFLKCDKKYFPSDCINNVQKMLFNITGQCLPPLVLTESKSSFFKDVEGCEVQCKDPLYTDDEYNQIQKLIFWGATICLVCNLFVIVTFIVNWQNSNKYPAVIIFYINLCFLINCLGWLVQFTSGSREDIVCRKDGTLRHSEPSAGENLSCLVVFVLVYYFLIAGMVWFVILTYAWHLRATGNVKDRIDKKGSYFHLIAWSLPLVLSITIMGLSEVDGNSMVGICFVGYRNYAIRSGFLLGPICAVILFSGYFIVRGMRNLIVLHNYTKEIDSETASRKIHLIIVRMSLCTFFTFICIIVTIICQIYEIRNSTIWANSLREFIICKITSKFTETVRSCKLESRPSVGLLQLHLLCVFGAGIVMSSWCWTSATISTWTRIIKERISGKPIVNDVKMVKSRIIAQAWARRKQYDDRGRLSMSFYNTHTDPVGLNFDVNNLNSTGTNDISTTWANYLPQCVKRRDALTGVPNSPNLGQRKSSLDSEISFSVRHVSVESRRNSVDSQLSVKIAEVQTKLATRQTTNRNTRHNKHQHSNFYSSLGKQRVNRRQSNTSIESKIITKATSMKKTRNRSSSGHSHHHHQHHSGASAGFDTYIKNIGNTNNNADVEMGDDGTNYLPLKEYNMKRRSACAGLVDADDINKLLKSGKLMVPFLQEQHLPSSSDDDDEDDDDDDNNEEDDGNIADCDEKSFNGSITSVKWEDERYDVLLCKGVKHKSGKRNLIPEYTVLNLKRFLQSCQLADHGLEDYLENVYSGKQEILNGNMKGSGDSREHRHATDDDDSVKNIHTNRKRRRTTSHNKDRSTHSGSRTSKHSSKSFRSRKSSKQSNRRNKKNVTNVSHKGTTTNGQNTRVSVLSKKAISDNNNNNNNSSSASVSSISLSAPDYGNELRHNSAKGQQSINSLNKCNGSSIRDDVVAVAVATADVGDNDGNFKNNKKRCDIGIQANSYEISTQTMNIEKSNETGEITPQTVEQQSLSEEEPPLLRISSTPQIAEQQEPLLPISSSVALPSNGRNSGNLSEEECSENQKLLPEM